MQQGKKTCCISTALDLNWYRYNIKINTCIQTNHRSNYTAKKTKEVRSQLTYLCIGNIINLHHPQTDPTFLFQTMFSFLLQAQQTFFLFFLFQQLALPLVMLQENIKQSNNKNNTRVSLVQLPQSDPSLHLAHHGQYNSVDTAVG